jgi:hypothetical protein
MNLLFFMAGLLAWIVLETKSRAALSHLARLAAEAITYANPTMSPKANGIHTLKLWVLKFICSIKLLMNSISSIEFPQVQYKVYIATLQQTG